MAKYQLLRGLVLNDKHYQPHMTEIWGKEEVVGGKKQKPILGWQVADPPVYVELPPPDFDTPSTRGGRDGMARMDNHPKRGVAGIHTKEQWDAEIKRLIEDGIIKKA